MARSTLHVHVAVIVMCVTAVAALNNLGHSKTPKQPADIKVIPLAPEWCVVPPSEYDCTFLGVTMTCVPGLDFAGPFGDGVTLGHVLVFVSLEVIAVLNFMYIDVHKPMFPQAMKISTTFYAFITGFFALARLVFQVGRPLLIGAALHNLSEWSFIIQITASDEATQKTRLLLATAWIIFVINFVVMMPTLGLAVLGEQSTGIVLDFALPLAYASLYFSGEPTRTFYRLPLAAHTIHLLFTILPLVFANFHVGQVSWYSSFFLEFAVYVSAPITHIMYWHWGLEFDDRKNAATAHDAGAKGSTLPASLCLEPHTTKRLLIGGFLLGLLPLAAVPKMLGPCASTPACAPNGEVIGTAVARVHPGFGQAFEDRISHFALIEQAKNAPGCVSYELVKSLNDSNEYHFVEHWESMAAVQAWTQTVPQKVFEEDDAMKGLLVGGALESLEGYTHLQPSACRPTQEGAISMDVGQSCDEVWAVISNWSDCSWVKGCEYATVDADNGNLRKMHPINVVAERVEMHNLNKRLTYLVSEPEHMKGYTGTLQSNEPTSDGGCHLTYIFKLPTTSSMSTTAVYTDFLMNRMPFIKTLFSKP